jgi:HAD superfamily hydrolase (TIGR01509 family)
MALTTLVFDFGNVVGFFSHRRAAEQLARYGPAIVPALQAALFGSPLCEAYDTGRLSTPAFIERVRSVWKLSCDDEQFAQAFSDIFAPNPEVCSLLPRLAERYRLLLLSNTNELHARQFLRTFAAELAPFERLVLSHEVGAMKPDPRIFTHCCQLAGSSPAECLLIDDLEPNVTAARACGWQGLVYRPDGTLARRLAELGIKPLEIER